MSNITYITSMNKQLYEATGRTCLESWAKHAWGSQLDIYYEGDHDFLEEIYSGNPWSDCGLYLDIMKSGILTNWLDANKDIIPKALGGEFVCKCPYNKKAPHEGHRKGCPAGGMRRRASQWHRKFVSVYAASMLSASDVIVWMDTDIVFKKPLPEQFIIDQLGEHDMLYHMGPTRRRAKVGTETGFWVFKAHSEIISEMQGRFASGEFRKYERWDEAWMLWEVLKDGKHNARDVVKKPTPTGHVVAHGSFAPYIKHNKGTHWSSGAV